MFYTRGLFIAATVALSGYLFKSYRTKIQEKEKNNFLQIHNQNHDLHSRKNFYLPTLLTSNKTAKINRNSHNSIQDKCWENVFKLKADEDNPAAVNQTPQTPWGYLEAIVHDVKVENQFREIARCLQTSHEFLRQVQSDELIIHNNLQQKELSNQNVYGLQEAKKTLKNLQKNRKIMEGQLVKAINAFHSVHSTKQNYPQLKKVIKRLDQNLSVLRQKLTETFNKEKLVYDDQGIELTFDDYDDDNEDENGAAAVNRNVPLGRFPDPKREYLHVLKYEDFSIVYSRRNRVPILSQEVLTRENIGEIEHRHWELISIVPDIPEALQATTNVCENNEFDVVRVGCGDLFPEPTASNDDVEQPVCEVCQNAPFWPLFYRYVKFLVDMHGYVNIFSGALYRPDPIPGIHTYEQNYAALTPDDPPTHFYKCIFVDYDNGTCRFECYLVPNTCMKDEIPKLKNFLVNKEMLERRITEDFNFEDTIIDSTPHKFFDHI